MIPFLSSFTGAVAVGFILFGTSFLFVNSHLTAHQENVKDRVKDLKKISAMLNLPKVLPLKKRHEIFDSYDCCFWAGDLNFRYGRIKHKANNKCITMINDDEIFLFTGWNSLGKR